MARIVAAGTVGVARCAPIGTQHATNPPPAQQGTQPPRNAPPPILYETEAKAAQQAAQLPRNSSATDAPRRTPEKLRVAGEKPEEQSFDIFASELVADLDAYRRWTVTLSGRDPFTVFVTPAANVTQMRAMYPGATRLHPVVDGEVTP